MKSIVIDIIQIKSDKPSEPKDPKIYKDMALDGDCGTKVGQNKIEYELM